MSSAQRRHMLQILPALLRAPFVAGLVLGGDQRVGAAAPFCREVKVAHSAPDALLDMGPPILDRLQAPLLLIRRNQERAQPTAVAACAFEKVSPGPVPWRLQRLGDAPAQVVERRLSETPHRRPRHAFHLLGKRTSGGDQHVVRLVCLRPGQQVLDRTRREPRIDPARRRRRSTTKPGVTGVGRVQVPAFSRLVGSPGETSIKAAPICSRSPAAPIGATTQRSSRSPQALGWAGALRLTIRTSSSVARGAGRRAAARTIVPLSDAA